MAKMAQRHLVGSFNGTHYVLADQRLDLSTVEARQAFAAEFANMWAQLSRNRDNWINDIRSLEVEFGGFDTPVSQAAAFSALCGVVKTDTLCRAACEYPKDRELVELAYRTLAANMATLDAMLENGQKRHEFDPTPSVELLHELQYASRLFDLKMQQVL